MPKPQGWITTKWENNDRAFHDSGSARSLRPLHAGAWRRHGSLNIDERAIRRFINGERPLSPGLLQDTAKALRLLIADATAAEAHLTATLATLPNDPPTPQA